MLTGPVTILQWSFGRDDQPRSETCMQIAPALRDEVAALETAGAAMIQVDESAIREGLPLRRRDWRAYLRWAVDAFGLATGGVKDETQIHTRMCYAEFGGIIEAVVELDADVLSMEALRSKMEILADSARVRYPSEIGPTPYRPRHETGWVRILAVPPARRTHPAPAHRGRKNRPVRSWSPRRPQRRGRQRAAGRKDPSPCPEWRNPLSVFR
jgi:hypothetical protein